MLSLNSFATGVLVSDPLPLGTIETKGKSFIDYLRASREIGAMNFNDTDKNNYFREENVCLFAPSICETIGDTESYPKLNSLDSHQLNDLLISLNTILEDFKASEPFLFSMLESENIKLKIKHTQPKTQAQITLYIGSTFYVIGTGKRMYETIGDIKIVLMGELISLKHRYFEFATARIGNTELYELRKQYNTETHLSYNGALYESSTEEVIDAHMRKNMLSHQWSDSQVGHYQGLLERKVDDIRTLSQALSR